MGNELDLWPDQFPPERIAKLAEAACRILKPVGIKVIASSLTSGDWQEYAQRLGEIWARKIPALRPDYACLHPYGKGWAGFEPEPPFGLISDAVNIMAFATKLPVALTECGIKIGEAGGESGQAEWVRRFMRYCKGGGIIPYACYFAWDDEVGAPSERGDSAFGLREVGGRRRPAWDAWAREMGTAVLPPPVVAPPPAPPVPQPTGGDFRYVLGFEAGHDAAPNFVGEPLENEYGGIKNLSMQATSRGFLTAAHLDGDADWTIVFYETATQKRHRFAGGFWRVL